jgi:hypothetical protein
MKHVHLLLPFALPHNELAQDLLRETKAPALATLISRAKALPREVHDDFARALPHERWMAARFGLAAEHADKTSPRIADVAMQACGLQTQAGFWFLLQPVHIHFARDHLVLTDMRQLALPEAESRILFDIAQPLFAEAGFDVRYGDTRRWFLRADHWSELATATPDAATGHNIDIWMPRGAAERDWRKVQNEVQMHWHAHPVNTARESRGEKSVNSLWLWGGAPAPLAMPAPPYHDAFNLPDWLHGVAHGGIRLAVCDDAQDVIAATSAGSLVMLDALLEPALGEDWNEWLVRLHQLEARWFGPLLDALKSGKIDQLTLILTHNTGLAEFPVSRLALRKFWIPPSLTRLAP